MMARGFSIPDKETVTIVCIFIKNYLPIHMCAHFILSDNGIELKNHLMDCVLQHLGTDCTFSALYHQQSDGKLEFVHKYFKPTLKKFV